MGTPSGFCLWDGERGPLLAPSLLSPHPGCPGPRPGQCHPPPLGSACVLTSSPLWSRPRSSRTGVYGTGIGSLLCSHSSKGSISPKTQTPPVTWRALHELSPPNSSFGALAPAPWLPPHGPPHTRPAPCCLSHFTCCVLCWEVLAAALPRVPSKCHLPGHFPRALRGHWLPSCHVIVTNALICFII